MSTKEPDTKILSFTCRPEQGMAALVTTLVPPKGYVFKEMSRKGTKATVLYVRAK